jgi:hypothetical protein
VKRHKFGGAGGWVHDFVAMVSFLYTYVSYVKHLPFILCQLYLNETF